MMTDRELLVLAAKAYGYPWKWDAPKGAKDGWVTIEKDGRWQVWIPLTDDGDALRLAVKLGLSITQLAMEVIVDDRAGAVAVIEPNDDRMAATRRAIVRAAAEIGRRMP